MQQVLFRSWLLVLLISGAAPSLWADAGLDFFEAKIRPVLVEHCYSCHAAEGKSVKGGLFLDSRAGMQQGGESGPAVVPHNVDESLIIEALRYESFEMPPKQRLPEEIVNNFVKWIEMGAPDPRDGEVPKSPEVAFDLSAAREFWAFQPPRKHAPPAPESKWATSEVDQFVEHELHQQGLGPSPQADRRTLIRRWSYDLTGLPPSVDEVEAFVIDESPDAFEKVVDRMLASQQYGEHWGRHWLDVARYADSNGGDINLTFHNAWRYRNYVVNAFNSDKPFDEFVREQLAGDLMEASDPAQQAEQLIASGYLVIGPKMLSERDKEKLMMDVVDEQLDSIGRTFLGLTLGCARCHDHKFDPIPTRDYYAMAGILRSTVVVEGIRMGNVNVSGWSERPLPMDAEHAAARSVYEQQVSVLQDQLKSAKSELARLQKSDNLALENLLGVVLDDTSAQLVDSWKKSSLSPSFIGAGYIHDEKQSKGEKRVVFTPELPNAGEYEVRISYTANEGRDSAVPVTIEHQQGSTTVKVDESRKPSLGGVFEPVGRYTFAAGTTGSVTISNAGTTQYVIVDAVQFVPVEQLQESPTAFVRSEQSPEVTAEIEQLSKRVKSLESELKDLRKSAPAPAPLAMAAEDRPEVSDCEVCIRGEPHNRGDAVPRGFLQVASPEGMVTDSLQGSGRLELANWIASTENPLTARVTVNRIWAQLFGAGLVRTVDNFGQLGERPTHPELLDSLAIDFMESGWSTKQLIRKLVLSQTYMQSAAFNSEAYSVDPENRFLWRHSRRRLAAEEIRDSLLALGGILNPSMGESPVKGMGESAVANNTNEKTGNREGDAVVRRTIYEPIIRNDLPEFLTVFDFADPDVCTSQRSNTNVPAQALWMMNSPFIRDQAERIASDVLQLAGDDDAACLDSLYLRMFGRPATPEEQSLATTFLAQSMASSETDANPSPRQAWVNLCHALLASTEFRFVE